MEQPPLLIIFVVVGISHRKIIQRILPRFILTVSGARSGSLRRCKSNFIYFFIVNFVGKKTFAFLGTLLYHQIAHRVIAVNGLC